MHPWTCRLFLSLLFFSVLTASAADVAFSDRFTAEIQDIADLINAGDFNQVFAKGESLLVRIQKDFPQGSFDEAKVRDFLVNAFYRSSRVMEPEAIVMGEEAIRLTEVFLGPRHPEVANSMMHLGNLYSRRWEPEKAIPYYEKALAILMAAGPDFDDQRAIILTAQGVAYRRLANDKRALKLYAEALAIQVRVLGPDHPDVASTFNNQGVVLSVRGDYTAAAELHLRALAIREKHFGPDHVWVAESLHNLSSDLGYLGQYDEALAMGERLMGIWESQNGTEHPRYWWAKMNLGVTHLDMGDYARALPLLEATLIGLENIYGDHNPTLCYAMDALANCRFAMGDFQPALDIYTKSLALAEEAYGVSSPETADTISRQGQCLMALDKLDEALDRLKLSLGIWETSLEQDNLLMCDLLHRLAELYLARNDPQQAQIKAARSKTICLRDLGSKHPLLAEATYLEARAQKDLGHLPEALDLALEAESISRNHLLQTMPVLSESLALDYAGSRIDGLNLAVSVLDDGESGQRTRQVWDAVIRSRSVVLNEYTARNRNLARGDNPLASALLDSTRVLRERLANLTLRGPGWEDVSVYQQLLSETDADLMAIERQLSLHNSSFRKRQADHENGFAQVVEHLPDGCALVAFKRCEEEGMPPCYMVFIQGEPNQSPVIRNLGNAEIMDAAVGVWRDQATFGIRLIEAAQTQEDPQTASRGFLKVPQNHEDQLKAYQAAGAQLRRLVWDPLAADLGSAQTVFLVPDGSLHLVSFPSLPLTDGRFLVEENRLLHMLTSEKTLIRDSVVQEGTGRLLAVGGPEFQLRGDSPPPHSPHREKAPGNGLEDIVFHSLPHTQSEVERIGSIWARQGREAIILAGSEATEKHLKSALPRTQVLHLATHGYFLPRNENQPPVEWDNPLIRSGLALAGANSWQQATSGENDGILTAQEVAALDLSQVQWAVLSACETGLGDLDSRGEGVFGLRRAFDLAGAGTVIMSLWSVDDKWSRHWMETLYQARWIDGESTASAVKQASCDILARRRAAGQSVHPYYWAGFVAAGDWR
jgi:CHAT domain-containing protein